MVQRGEQLRLALEAGEAVWIDSEEFGQDLQRDVAIEPRVARAIHLAHATRADQGDDFVGAEPGAGGYRHRRGVPRIIGQRRGTQEFPSGRP